MDFDPEKFNRVNFRTASGIVFGVFNNRVEVRFDPPSDLKRVDTLNSVCVLRFIIVVHIFPRLSPIAQPNMLCVIVRPSSHLTC